MNKTSVLTDTLQKITQKMKVVSLISELSWSTNVWRTPNTLQEMLSRPLVVRHQEKKTLKLEMNCPLMRNYHFPRHRHAKCYMQTTAHGLKIKFNSLIQTLC